EDYKRRSNSLRNRNSTKGTATTKTGNKIRVTTGSASLGSSSMTIPNGRIFEAVFASIKDQYRFEEELTAEKKSEMIDAAIAAMVKEMGDKYSSYIEPTKADAFTAGLAGQFEGIGAYVEMIDDNFTITSPIKGSPAEKAGVLPDDIVTAVDGEDIKDKSIQESIALIKGPAETAVTLTILRGLEVKQITVIRGKITIPSVTIKWDKSIPVIGIHQFNRDTKAKFEKILKEEVLTKNPKGLVIDLRNNPGGFLTSAVSMGEFFLNKGDLVFSVDYKKGGQEYTSSRKGELYDFWKKDGKKIAILQNKGSASASEIFTTMIQDYNIGEIVGTVSRGKGTVQEVKNYSNGGILKLTIAKWLSPKGRWIHEKGIIPGIEVEDPTAEERKAKIDLQFDRAVRYVLGG
ncbi:MAG: S41 family peptidase, partial [Candidatus Peregrinibacteria bacterium]|nr:S41 family peptidase [Candidatus Peregrinibacteria bacterium]